MDATRSGVVTPSARSLPAAIWPETLGITSIMNEMRPPSRSVMAAPPPLYGMCMTLMPAIWLSSSQARCDEVPLPAEPQVSSPGRDLA